MKKRVLTAALWAYATWYACNVLGAFAGFALPGLIVGLAAGALVLALPVVQAQRVAGHAPISTPARIPTES